MGKIMFNVRQRSSVLLKVVCPLGFFTLAVAQGAQEMPKIEGESFAGAHVVLPDATSGKVAILVFGFSKASKGPTSEWAKKISAEYANQPSFALYQLPVLEGVPRFIRGTVISGIRKVWQKICGITLSQFCRARPN
jgi:hypothetical protein